jgi:hypothetical protein
MENNRPKISSLTEKELAELLNESFFKVGKQVKLAAGETKIFLDEVYQHQGWMYVDIFSEAFSKYAACELPDAEGLRPCVSSLFIGKLMKIYFKKCNEQRFIRKQGKGNPSNLSAEEKYTLYLKHVTANQCLPANPDWVSIYEHLTGLNKINPLSDWNSFGYSQKLKQARQAVTEWTCKQFNIRENLIYKNTSNMLKGNGVRLG